MGSLLTGCREEKVPAGVLSKEEYAAFLVEVYLAEARLNTNSIQRDSAIGLYVPFEEKLLQKRGISDSVIKITYQYYLSHPNEFEEVYTSVIDTLTLREQRYKK